MTGMLKMRAQRQLHANRPVFAQASHAAERFLGTLTGEGRVCETVILRVRVSTDAAGAAHPIDVTPSYFLADGKTPDRATSVALSRALLL